MSERLLWRVKYYIRGVKASGKFNFFFSSFNCHIQNTKFPFQHLIPYIKRNSLAKLFHYLFHPICIFSPYSHIFSNTHTYVNSTIEKDLKKKSSIHRIKVNIQSNNTNVKITSCIQKIFLVIAYTHLPNYILAIHLNVVTINIRPLVVSR